MTQHDFRLALLTMAGLLMAQAALSMDATNLALAKSQILEGNVGYLRIAQVSRDLPEAISAAQTSLAKTNKIVGTVLDLRYANGDDASVAATTAQLLESAKLPLAILVNGQTRGAAVTLASALRDARAGLVFSTMPAAVKVDIAVEESPADDAKFFADPYAPPATNELAALTGTNDVLPWVDHTSEADLVRARIKDGAEFENPPPHTAGPQKPVVRDPVLARALDLIKGLAIVRGFHP